jgi:hypothetical protein
MKKDVNVAGRHGNHVIWNKGLAGKNDPRCMAVGRKISQINTGNPKLQKKKKVVT